jgi:hypothetical protein
MAETELRRTGSRDALLGFVIIHLASFALMFWMGVILGSGPAGLSPVPATQVRGIQGGLNAMGRLIFAHAMTLGTGFLVISVFGAAAGSFLGRALNSTRHVNDKASDNEADQAMAE